MRPISSRPLTHHMCPRRGCKNEVDNRLFCCSGDWWALSHEARSMINRTARLNILDWSRRAAISMAKTEWSRLNEEGDE